MVKIGLLEKIFHKKNSDIPSKAVQQYFKMLSGYTPSFSTYNGSIFEFDLCRSAIDKYATMCSKLKPEIQGSAYKNLEKTLQFKPNPWMNTSQFLYRLATILQVNTTAFVLPLYADDFETITGFYPLLPQRTEIIDVKGEPWLRYRFLNGQTAAIEYDRVGVLTRFQYKNDFFGDGNDALYPTINLLDTQKQSIINGVTQSAQLRFIARLSQTINPTDLKKERELFSSENLSSENTSGVLMFDKKYSDVQQIESKPLWIDDKQMEIIQDNVFNYFGTNKDILQNKYNEDTFNAWYEGSIEPFALQLSLVLTNMLFSQKQIAFGNEVVLSANRLQYASNQTKLSVSQQLFDRSILTINQVMEIWNMPHVEDGDKRYIRKEYTEISMLDKNSDKGDEPDALEVGQQGVSATADPAADTTE